MRRCQQDELYRAEDLIEHGEMFQSHAEIERWCNSLRETWWWSRFYPRVEVIEVTPSTDPRASVGAYYEGEGLAVLNLHEVHFYEHYVLHELAHPLAKARFGSTSHDPFFARVLLELTFLVRGQEAWEDLGRAFEQYGIVIDDTDEAELHRQRMLGAETWD